MKSLAAMPDVSSKDIRQRRLTAAMLECQKEEKPIHQWPVIETMRNDDWEQGYRTVGQFMSTDLFTVQPDDLIDLAASMMDWRHVRHVPVEDEAGHLVGLITHRTLLRMMGNGVRTNGGAESAGFGTAAARAPITVRELMVKDPITVSPSTPSLEAIDIMRRNRVGCLPVVDGNQLVGIVTSYDFLEASARLFQQHITEQT
jgi:CBS domain-containing protein